MTEKDDTEQLYKTSMKGEGPRGLVADIGAKEVAFFAWVVTAGMYGFAAARWGSATVDTTTLKPYPEYAWFFLFMGLAIGVAFSATIALMGEDNAE